MILAGNVALGVDGLRDLRLRRRPPRRVGAGRRRVLGSGDHVARRRALLGRPRAREAARRAVQMGLIYVNPEGPNGNPDPLASARDIRETFGRMAMNDEETVALIAGGHTFGKTHGAAPDTNLEDNPEAAGLEQQGLGWKNNFGTGHGRRHHHVGPRGHVDLPPHRAGTTSSSTSCTRYEWELMRSPAGGHQWRPKQRRAAPTWCRRARLGDGQPRAAHADQRPGAALRPGLRRRSRAASRTNPEAFADAFARAWFKLTHRDMGPIARYLGPEVPARGAASGRTRVPAVDHELIDADGSPRRSRRRSSRRAVGIRARRDRRGPRRPRSAAATSAAASTAPASASAPQKDWEVNDPAPAGDGARATLEQIQASFNDGRSRRQGRCRWPTSSCSRGNAAVEKAAADAGVDVEVPFHPGRTDATQEQTDVESFALRSSRSPTGSATTTAAQAPAEEYLLLDRANLLTLSAPELTVLVGGLRVLGANCGRLDYGVFTDRPGRAHQRLLREPARPGHGVEAARRRRARRSRARRTASGEVRSAPAPASTCVFGLELRAARRRRGATRATTRRRSSCATSSRRGARSPSSTGSTSSDPTR